MHDQVIRGGRATRIGLQRYLQLIAAALHSGCDFTPYEGREVTGKPVTVLCRGRPVIVAEKLVAAPGSGVFAACRPVDPAGLPAPVEETMPWRAG